MVVAIVEEEPELVLEPEPGIHWEYHASDFQQYEPAAHVPKLPWMFAHWPHKAIVPDTDVSDSNKQIIKIIFLFLSYFFSLRDEAVVVAEPEPGIHCEYHASDLQQYEPAAQSPKLPWKLAHCPHNGIVADTTEFKTLRENIVKISFTCILLIKINFFVFVFIELVANFNRIYSDLIYTISFRFEKHLFVFF